MRKYSAICVGLFFTLCSFISYATTCPDPETTSLKWGVIPEPWEENPFSVNRPQGEENTLFVRANILVAGFGHGVMCTYRNSIGEYSIWWQVPTKIPARTDYDWIDVPSGYICTRGLSLCNFYTAG